MSDRLESLIGIAEDGFTRWTPDPSDDEVAGFEGLCAFARAAEARVEAADVQLLAVLAAFYDIDPVVVADLCDTRIDTSGALLGKVRDAVAAAARERRLSRDGLVRDVRVTTSRSTSRTPPSLRRTSLECF